MKSQHEKLTLEEILENAKYTQRVEESTSRLILNAAKAFTLTILTLSFFIVSFLFVSITGLNQFVGGLPLPLDEPQLYPKTQVFAEDAEGNDILIGVYYNDNREVVSNYEIPQLIKNATVAAEDAKFYNHNGLDVEAIARAAAANLTNRDFGRQGGSTITQQYVKNVLINQALQIPNKEKSEAAYNAAIEDTVSRKIREARHAMYIESVMSKDEILEGYLNIVGFGGNMYGIKVGAKYYFGKELKDLTLSEAATLVSIVNNPNTFRIDNPESETNGEANGYAVTKERRNYVLDRMLAEKFITQSQHQAAFAEPIVPIITPFVSGCLIESVAFFCDYVKSTILNDERYGKTSDERWNLFYKGGLTIRTTLDMGLQEVALKSMEARVPYTSDVLKIGASAVTVENRTGRILAMVQNKKFSNDPELAAEDDTYTAVNYNTTRAFGGSSGFQPGSTFKVFTLIEWLKAGHRLYENVYGYSNYKEMTNTCDGMGKWMGDYTVKNHTTGYEGNITAMTATTVSINTAYMSMAAQLDLCNIGKMANVLGVGRADGDGLYIDPPMVIGSNEVSPLAMTGAYASIGNGGKHCPTTPLDSVTDATGKSYYASYKVSCIQAIDPEINKAVLKALRNTASYGTATAGKPYDGSDVFAKTGTTDDTMDTWIIGGTTEVTTGIWVGNTINKVTLYRLYANGASAPQYRFGLFKDIMTYANTVYLPHKFQEPDPSFLY